MKALLHGIAEGNGRTLRNLLGLLIFIGGGYLLGRHALLLAELNLPAPIVLALKGGLLCAFGTALGAMPVLVVKTMPARLSDALLGFGAGVMLSATAFSLIMPALSAAGDLGYSKFGAGFLVSFGLAVGVMGLFILGRLMPDVHPGCEGAPLSGGIPPRILLFVTAIVLHNIPEGMAVGVSAGAGLDEANGLALASLCRMCRKVWWWRWCWPESVCRVSRRCWSVPRRAWSSRCSRCSAPGWSASPRCSCPGAGRRGGSDALRGHPRDHSRVPPPGTCRRGYAGPGVRFLPDDGAGDRAGLGDSSDAR